MLVPFVVLFLICDCIEYRYLYSGILFLIASYTDYLDGKLARSNSMITDFGKIMDPLADKILIASILICFSGLNLIPILAVVIIISREFIITSLRFLILQNNGKVVPANILGKLKTVSQIAAIMFVFIVQSYLEFSKNSSLPIEILCLQNVLVWISALFSILSGVSYVFSNKEYIVFNS